MTFDRAQFEQHKSQLLDAQAQDAALNQLGREFTLQSDKHGYAYQWTWLGLPIIQLPQDILITQELFWRCKPDFIIETGIAWGGSVVLHASLLELMGGDGQVIAVDSALMPHIAAEIMKFPFSHRIRLLSGDSTDETTIASIKAMIPAGKSVATFLDSNHTHAHVLSELRAYGPLVTPGQYLTVYATAIENMPASTHRPRAWGPGNNPMTAVEAYLKETDRFCIDLDIDRKPLSTFAPHGRLRCVGDGSI